MKNGKNKSIAGGVTLTNFEREIVNRESERRGLYNFSATLRQIIREWKQLTEQPLPTADLKEDTQK